jgi:hypothetical protein
VNPPRYSLLLLLAALATGAPTREVRRQQIRAALLVPETLPALAAEHYGQVEIAPGVIAERVSYATDYGLRVPVILYRPTQKPAGKMPGLIVVNGHGGEQIQLVRILRGDPLRAGGQGGYCLRFARTHAGVERVGRRRGIDSEDGREFLRGPAQTGCV